MYSVTCVYSEFRRAKCGVPGPGSEGRLLVSPREPPEHPARLVPRGARTWSRPELSRILEETERRYSGRHIRPKDVLCKVMIIPRGSKHVRLSLLLNVSSRWDKCAYAWEIGYFMGGKNSFLWGHGGLVHCLKYSINFKAKILII